MSKPLFFDQIIWLQIIWLCIYPLQTENLAKTQDMVQFHLANAQRHKDRVPEELANDQECAARKMFKLNLF